MTEPVTANKGFVIPNTGDLVNAWGPALNGNFALLDALLGSSAVINISSGAYALTNSEIQNFRIAFIGTLTGPVDIVVPGKAGFYTFHDATNRTSSVFPISITTGGSYANQNLPAGISQVFCDTENIIPINFPQIGAMQPFAGVLPPPLWMPCAGQAISRTAYAGLFNVISTAYGSGDGSTTFNLPDMRGRTPFAPDAFYGSSAAGRLSAASGFESYAIGTSGGSELLQSHNHALSDLGHTHVIADPGHNHSQNPHGHLITDPGHAHSVTDPGHAHTYSGPSGGPVGTAGSAFLAPATGDATSAAMTGISIQASQTNIAVNINAATNNAAFTGITNNAAFTGITVNNNGNGGSQNMPPALLVPWIIYAGQ